MESAKHGKIFPGVHHKYQSSAYRINIDRYCTLLYSNATPLHICSVYFVSYLYRFTLFHTCCISYLHRLNPLFVCFFHIYRLFYWCPHQKYNLSLPIRKCLHFMWNSNPCFWSYYFHRTLA